MEAPPSRNRHDLPSIYVDHRPPATLDLPPMSSRPFSQGTLPFLAAMSIPGTDNVYSDNNAPPPLPPPQYVIDNPDDDGRYGPRPVPVPSDYGSLDEDRQNYQSRTEKDEGYSSLESYGSNKPHTGLHHQQYHFTSSDYDSSVLKKLDGRRPMPSGPNRSPPRTGAGLVASLSDVPSTRGPDSRYPQRHPPLSLPIRASRPSHSHDHTPTSAASPRTNPYYAADFRSPIDFRPLPSDYRNGYSSPSDLAESPFKSRRTNSGSVADDMTSAYGGSIADETDFPAEETRGMRSLRIEDAHPRAEYRAGLIPGIKRRASSPPLEPTHHVGELFRRRDPTSRSSPTPRLSLVSSASHPGSYSLPLSAAPTTLGSFSHRSPAGMSPMGSDLHRSPSMPLASTPRATAPPLISPHQRTTSDGRPIASPRKLTDGRPSPSSLQGFFMCDCCPKKPKKFNTPEELAAHEAEKQYGCNYCGNRFKNKNEAERHQNSLHVRRHSWSCSALTEYGRAYHESTTRPGEADTCGYCGDDFLRTGGTGRLRQVTEQDWDVRICHLQEVHKFRECNAVKKFYRADHFRQHLKHSHAGTSGKWTNMLENACMLEEDPPAPRS